ncbi:hypothetical protein PIB30_070646 [Stylosanthes scabra]|uniref:Uncharacterized protein n=1 Tax=Stylosanthes scabra TaxID=79078 RepID=A0ABU6XN79_9FABA|nr:hypothetical protein [Stylosanthes scabra]
MKENSEEFQKQSGELDMANKLNSISVVKESQLAKEDHNRTVVSKHSLNDEVPKEWENKKESCLKGTSKRDPNCRSGEISLFVAEAQSQLNVSHARVVCEKPKLGPIEMGWGAGAGPIENDSNFTKFLINPISMAKFGVEVAKESASNEKIAKSLRAKSRAYAYPPKEPMRTHCHALGVTS